MIFPVKNPDFDFNLMIEFLEKKIHFWNSVLNFKGFLLIF